MPVRLLPPVSLHRLTRAGLLLFFLWLTGRFWHPYYGFTRFLQMDEASAATTLPELRAAPIFLYADGYDGHYYAQLAARPAVRDPALAGAIDSVGYRARRILLSWVAWAAGGGDPVAAVRAYAALNLAIWAGLAALLWRIFPAAGWRETLAWGGVLFSAGVMHSVRLALTDLAGLALLTGALWLVERGREKWAAGFLAAAGLVRETALLGAVALLPPGRATRGDWLRAAGWMLLCAVPLVAWVGYLRAVWGWSEPGLGNFAPPFAGWAAKGAAALSGLLSEPDRYLALTTLLAFVALTVQAAFVVLQPRPRDRWWRLGAVHVGLLALLGTAVWEGHPGAATRILLPLTLAFNVLAVRGRAGAGWLVAGNLSVLAGVLIFWSVPQHPHELAAGRSRGGGYVVRTDARWYPAEQGRDKTWAWCAQTGGVDIRWWPRADGPVEMRMAVRGITLRPLEIRQAGRVLWSGEVGEKLQWIGLSGVTARDGHAGLEIHSGTAPVREGTPLPSAGAPASGSGFRAPFVAKPGQTGGRELGFALYGVRIN